MAGQSVSPLRRDQPERRELLVNHFIEVLEPILAGGAAFNDLSVEQIIRAGGIARGTFYAYFADKGDLLRAMAVGVGRQIADTGPAWWDLEGDITEARLREALRPAVEAYLQHRTLLRSVAELAGVDPTVRDAYGTLMATTIERLTAHIEARGIDADAGRTATWLIWMFERGLYQAVSVADDAEPWLDSAARLVYRVLYA